MNGYELELAQLRRAAAAAQSGGEQLSGVDTDVVPAEAEALPGSRSGTKITGLTDAWRRTAARCGQALRDYGTNVAGCADRYSANDEDAAAVFGHQRFHGATE